MIIEDWCIKDIGYSYGEELEAELLECFKMDSHIIIFSWNKKDLKRKIINPITKFDYNKFVLEREVFRTKEKLYPWFINGENIWYSPKNKQELVDILKFEGITYFCCTIPNTSISLKDKIFTFHTDEHDYRVDENAEYRSIFFSLNENINENIVDSAIIKVDEVIKKYEGK